MSPSDSQHRSGKSPSQNMSQIRNTSFERSNFQQPSRTPGTTNFAMTSMMNESIAAGRKHGETVKEMSNNNDNMLGNI
jgi:hypothetical protein